MDTEPKIKSEFSDLNTKYNIKLTPIIQPDATQSVTLESSPSDEPTNSVDP